MKALINTSPIKTFGSLPKIWNNIINFDKASEEVIRENGFRDIVKPEHDSNAQYLSPLFYDEVNDVFTYNVIDYTEEEIRQRTVPAEIRREQGLLMLRIMDKYNTVLAVIDAMPEGEDKERAKFYFENWSTWERSSAIIDSLAPYIFPTDTEKELDDFFIEASKLR